MHDKVYQTNIQSCLESQIVIGPNQTEVLVRDCHDCQFVIFSKSVRLQDCSSCEVMIYTPEYPKIENCRNIRFSTMTYQYQELLGQMLKANLSPWNNLWH